MVAVVVVFAVVVVVVVGSVRGGGGRGGAIFVVVSTHGPRTTATKTTITATNTASLLQLLLVGLLGVGGRLFSAKAPQDAGAVRRVFGVGQVLHELVEDLHDRSRCQPHVKGHTSRRERHIRAVHVRGRGLGSYGSSRD